MLPILISTPHSSSHVPYWLLARMLQTGEPEDLLRRRLFREGDPFSDVLFNIPDAEVILNAPASRFVADLNRDRTESGENGVIKLTDFERRPFFPTGYALSREEAEARLSQYYDPYHSALEKYLSSGKIRFFIDGHSMLSHGPAIGPDHSQARPAICLGNFGDAEGNALPGAEPTSCEPDLARRLRSALQSSLLELIRESGLKEGVCLNQPFDGGYILRKYSTGPKAVPGLMIEVNRALYLDESTALPIPGRIPKLNKALNRIVASILSGR